MEVDGGGWTLFLNYRHEGGSGSIKNMDVNKLPANLQANSHMYLKNAGFTERDVTNLRFQCTEMTKDIKLLWHFTTTNDWVKNAALTGQQQKANNVSLQATYKSLPKATAYSEFTEIDTAKLGKMEILGAETNGGLMESPFKFGNYNWTINGKGKFYECGSNHTGDASPDAVTTHHSIWFRGEALNEKEARARYETNIKGLNK
jgi:hypothetical protein